MYLPQNLPQGLILTGKFSIICFGFASLLKFVSSGNLEMGPRFANIWFIFTAGKQEVQTQIREFVLNLIHNPNSNLDRWIKGQIADRRINRQMSDRKTKAHSRCQIVFKQII